MRRFWNNICQLILWIYVREGHRYELRPPVSLQPFEQKWLRRFEIFFWNWRVFHKVLTWYLPTHSVDLSCKGHKYERWFAFPVQYNPLTDMKKNNFISQWMVSGGSTLLSKHVRTLYLLFQKLAYDTFAWYSHQNRRCQSNNEIIVRDANKKQYKQSVFSIKMNPSNRILNLEFFL